MELPATAVYSPGSLGKGFDEVMPHNDNEFLVKTIENVDEKLHFLSFFGEKCVSLNLMTQNGLCKIFGHSYAEKVSCIGKFFFGYSLN
jgi:hypothetical protein